MEKKIETLKSSENIKEAVEKDGNIIVTVADKKSIDVSKIIASAIGLEHVSTDGLYITFKQT